MSAVHPIHIAGAKEARKILTEAVVIGILTAVAVLLVIGGPE